MIRMAPLVAALAFASPVLAAGHDGDPNIKARQAHMQLYGYNLGLLGGMAKGEIDYDAEAASAAAANLAALSGMDQHRYWAEGTDNVEMEGASKALPIIWDQQDDFFAKQTALHEAAMSLAEVAGNGQEAIGPALGPVGQACGACHQTYRQSNN